MKLFVVLISLYLLEEAFAAPRPVDKKKETEKNKDDNKESNADIDDFGLEYGRYLKQVVQALEEDKEFAKKLENFSAEDIQKGDIARELEFVKHSVRSKLDELKRMEVERLRRLTLQEIEQNELGLYRNEDGHLLPAPPEGRKWRTIPRPHGGKGFNRKNIKVPVHIDPSNAHTFEEEDLKRLIQTATRDLEELDRKRREEFKRYEMEKEYQYRESLKNLTEDEKKEAERKHEEKKNKHKEHPRVNHPGSKPQLEQVWEEKDHMPREEFDPKVFFSMHDINGDGYLDEDEVEAILNLEVKKMYDPNNPEDDAVEMIEEYNRMREHVYSEADKDKDKRISQKEFLDLTQQQDFEEDEGWKGLDEQAPFSEEELKEYEREKQAQMQAHLEAQRQATMAGQQQSMLPQQQFQGVPQNQQFQEAPQKQQIQEVPEQQGASQDQQSKPPRQEVPQQDIVIPSQQKPEDLGKERPQVSQQHN
ncbi:nucleobindin-2-like isoform X2 [Limulus polyphemus]|nr:nucleobindin-2-like isoform X2 [Limulus polyphemus]XP_013780092.1 nucleobindin-2-like isoform X2 [Limulus polyphemus]XP_022247930.1 nucleobindin-2-like isoform X2 [Limulus polyphemus]